MYKILKYALGVILTISGLATIFQGSFVGGLLVALGGLSIIPPISEKNKAKYPFWRNKYLRRGVTGFFLIVGFAIIGNQIENNDDNAKELSQTTSNKEPQQVLDRKEKLNLSSIKWSNRFKRSQVRGEWYQVLYYFPENKNEITYLDDGGSEQKKLTLTASTYQTSYPYGSGDNPIFNYYFEGGNLIVTTKTALASKIYTFKVEFGNKKKLLRLTQENGSIQVFKRKEEVTNESVESVNTLNKNEVKIIDLSKVSFDANGNKVKPDENDVTFKIIEVLRHRRKETPMSKHNFELIDLLIETSSYKKEDLEEIALRLKEEHSDFTPNNCNLSLWDSKKAYQLDEQRQNDVNENEKLWDKKHYVFVADHLIGWIPLGTYIFQYYPYQDDQYKKLGGKNYKK